MLYQNFFRLSPGFCFADGLASLALLRQGMKDKSSNAVFDWNVTGASLCYLGFEVNFLIPPSSAIMFLTLKFTSWPVFGGSEMCSLKTFFL
jgi:ATP-binding cassette subfamily A (ABC1) protein 3